MTRNAPIRLVRHLMAIATLPFVVAVVVPLSIARRTGAELRLARAPLAVASQVVGVVALGLGFVLFASSVYWFATRGAGTLAPWDPPRRLVVDGPYRHVRNPMIAGVIFVLFAEALLLLSALQTAWAVIFLVANLVYLPVIEEPQLERRFGEPYREYCRHVPRFVPRLRPWTPGPP
jgi:protein-S-isoprenylcysteine O-methyltransferase Ste14